MFSTYIVTLLTSFLITIFFSMNIFKKNYKEKLKAETKLDITPAQMKMIETSIKRFLDEHELQGETNIYKIAKAMDVYEGRENPRLHCQAYINERNKNGRMEVEFLPRLTKEDRKFYFAHECGHVINGDPVPNNRTEGHGKPEIEQLADYAGAALLMPYDIIEKMLMDSNFAELSKNDKRRFIKQLCRRFDVNEVTAIKRVKEVTLLMAN